MGRDHDDDSLRSARRAAADGDLADWVVGFLANPGSDNAALGEQLAETVACWLGPVELPVDRLHRLTGPPDQPVLCPLDDADLERSEDMAESIDDGWEPPPMVVTWRDGQLVVEDGNHRIEALRRAGRRRAWCVVGFPDAAERDRFEPPAAAST